MVDDTREVEVLENALGMSDEDILNMPEPTDEIVEPVIEDTKDIVDDADEEAEEDDEADANDDDEGAAEESELEDDTQSTGELEEEGSEEDESGHESSDDSTAEDEESKPVAKKAAGKKSKKAKAEETEVSVKSSDDLLKELFTPFKANGKDMQVASIDDARTLMQMGANYNKKMQGLKPNLKLMKMLDNNKLLDEQKLSYLIDLSNKNPEAIAKLIQESGIDPLEMDMEKPTEYKPNTYTVEDKEVELDQVLLGIEDTPSFQETIDIISNKWDDSSKKVLLEKPTLIAAINDQVSSGIYGQINSIVEQERMVGRLTELSDLEAYKHVGDVLQSQGVFNQQPQNKQGQQAAPIIPKAKAKEDPKLKAKRKAASGTKSSPKAKNTSSGINPLELSDEEFMKATAQM